MSDDADRAYGNRSWRIETPKGPALQKLYRERGGPVSVAARAALVRLAGTKTSARAAARCATERRLLRLWRDAGLPVPGDWTDDLPQFGGPCVAVLEFVEGATPLWDLVVRPGLADAGRDAALRLFAAEWGRRHATALRTGDAGFVQEHGTIRHALVAGDRLVWIDLEQAFLPRSDLRPILAKEIAGYVRSLWKRAGEERFRRDVAVVAEAYPDRAVLRSACDEYLAPGGVRRWLWAADRAVRSERRRRAKYGALEVLAEVVRS